VISSTMRCSRQQNTHAHLCQHVSKLFRLTQNSPIAPVPCLFLCVLFRKLIRLGAALRTAAFRSWQAFADPLALVFPSEVVQRNTVVFASSVDQESYDVIVTGDSTHRDQPLIRTFVRGHGQQCRSSCRPERTLPLAALSTLVCASSSALPLLIGLHDPDLVVPVRKAVWLRTAKLRLSTRVASLPCEHNQAAAETSHRLEVCQNAAYQPSEQHERRQGTMLRACVRPR